MSVLREQGSCHFAHAMKNRERLGPEGLQGWDAIVSVARLTTPLGPRRAPLA